jgi:phage antirepressor YoqD-like protein
MSDFNSGILKSSEDIHDRQLVHHAEAIRKTPTTVAKLALILEKQLQKFVYLNNVLYRQMEKYSLQYNTK